jgi:suppressor of ftsI
MSASQGWKGWYAAAGALALVVVWPTDTRAQVTDTMHRRPGGEPTGMATMAEMSGMAAEAGDSVESPSGRMIIPMIKSPMIPGLEGVQPAVALYNPGNGRTGAAVPLAKSSADVRLNDGDTLSLTAGFVRRTIAGKSLVLYAFNGEAPGPLIRARQGSTFFVRFRNEIDRPATIHWHGVRLANASDGSPQMTQPPVAPGGTFVYAVHCPDAGIFWYHDHAREDIGLPLGLYGNVIVEPDRPPPGTSGRQVFLILNDILIAGDTLVPFGREAPNFSLMGRFGNLLLINGEPRWQFAAVTGDVVRFAVTNAASARTFNLSFGDASMKLIASDQGHYGREVAVTSIVIAPGERYVVDVRFDRPGVVPILNQVQTVDHFLGEIYASSDTLGHVAVTGQANAAADPAFATLHDDTAALGDFAKFRPAFDKPPDEDLVLTTAIKGLTIPVMQMMAVDTVYRPPVEWTDGMSDMNWLATGHEVRWIIRDKRSGAENMQLGWHFHVGDVIKVRVYNDPQSFHPMDHPLHLHGQRFLVVARDGRPNPFLVWKDTAIVPVGSTIDLLFDLSNPGTWMLHCHIAEHVESGMMAPITVSAR